MSNSSRQSPFQTNYKSRGPSKSANTLQEKTKEATAELSGSEILDSLNQRIICWQIFKKLIERVNEPEPSLPT